ncbi:MAG: type II toxin-antitoxin system VapC family toxin [Terriglobales bacterium]
MVLVDTSVWIQHLRYGEARLVSLLGEREVQCHPFVLGELAMGNLRRRAATLEELTRLPMAALASDAEVRSLVESRRLHGRGLSYSDAHLLASLRLASDATLWTADQKLRQAAAEMGLEYAGRRPGWAGMVQ